MGWFILAHIFSTILSLIQVRRLSEKDKDLEIVILRLCGRDKSSTPISVSKILQLTSHYAFIRITSNYSRENA